VGSSPPGSVGHQFPRHLRSNTMPITSSIENPVTSHVQLQSLPNPNVAGRDEDVTFTTGKIELLAVSGKHDEANGKVVALTSGSLVRIWSCSDRGEIGKLDIRRQIDAILFVGSSLIVLSKEGCIGFWNGFSQTWLVKDIPLITCFDSSGSLLFFGDNQGRITYIDIEKFPLRLSDESLLINDFYLNPTPSTITCLSVYFTPFSGSSSHEAFIEVAFWD